MANLVKLPDGQAVLSSEIEGVTRSDRQGHSQVSVRTKFNGTIIIKADDEAKAEEVCRDISGQITDCTDKNRFAGLT